MHPTNVKEPPAGGVVANLAYIALQQPPAAGVPESKKHSNGGTMEWKRRAFAGLGRGSSKRRGMRSKLLVALGTALGTALVAGVAHAGPDADCAAVNRGDLNVALEAEGGATRRVALQAGDTLTFNFEAAAGPFGTLTLLKGAGAPRSLLVGPTGTSVAFVAARRGAFDFEFSKEGADAAAFTASCVPSGSARGRASATASRRSARLLGESWNGANNIEAAELAGVVVDTDVPAPSRGSTVLPWASASNPAVANTLPSSAGGLDTRLQWRGERSAGGPDGAVIDNSASGVEAALNYKPLPQIMVGALAQVDQPGETLVGAPLGLSDRGWMVGPVTNVRLAPGLTLDARAAWGVAESTTDELAARTVSVPRRMVSARLANTQSFGPWRVSPSVSVNHSYEAAVAPASTAIHDASVPYAGGFGRVDAGPELAYRIDLDKSGFIEPRAVIGTFWDFETLSRLAPGTAGHHELRLRAEAGVTIGATDGTKLQAAGTVEEGEAGTADIWSGRLQLSVPMQ